MLIDTHAHLYWESYQNDLDLVIQRAKDAGITAIINVGVDIEKSREALQICEKLDMSGVEGYSTVAIHPHEAAKYISNETLKNDTQQLEQIYLSNPKKVVGIGECGLDYFFESNPGFIPPSITIDEVKVLQKKLLQAQVDLAKKLNLPLIIHCRDDRSKDPENSEAWDDTLEILGDQSAILHCYSGLSHNTSYILHTTNLTVSFAGNITYPKNEYLREAVKLLPLDRIVLETDSPFLAPQSKRGQRNEPSSVKEIAELIADLKGVSFEEVASQTTQNAKSVFNI
ncbi:MAG: hypothetical protein ACD_38C00002G0005 [uncultured bacterium]|nr:MAG: hypothetical protein ACD_38C00002G0005 [uncultured bacterium]KKQ83587.1 MAG: Hydrolase, TatD family [Candidatus Daviesbacteria bacterium GW2011_GWF2_38_7]KKR25358.1 MAG: Hydrolase, TatD family [Candidatus Daviesbacteria bacterium GW2011_GWB1_39_5]OGE20803.1 MAG: hypothetical protein A2778_06045 [Candidatus Daviesbacteria bacterium RIFCSPHIGHO2_01_FULL_40_24]OGE41776.1 MAG: hypothetical protein A3A53_04700 [Candidatus Daviesbacteria bacterium RIFCSPLOWO2_01_FULL_39_23]OGE66574.1 MAG: hy